MELVRSPLKDLPGALRTRIEALLSEAFPDAGAPYDYGPDAPTLFLLLDDVSVVAHAAASERAVVIGDARRRIGLIGGVAVAPGHRGRGHARTLMCAAHGHFRERGLPFSVLFADEPAVYRSSGYHEMTNLTRLIEAGEQKAFVYRGGMAAALSGEPWPQLTLDLLGPAV